jgi:GT2 family glycosyltransferase
MMITTRTAGLSVVIPVKGRVELLRNLLASLQTARANCPADTEAIVVDDSDPQDAQAHRRNCEALGARYLRGPARVGAKRNIGARHARHDLLVFVDSDCEVDPGYLTQIDKSLRAAPPEVGGIAGPVEMIGEETSVLRLFRRTQELNQPFGWPARYEQITWSACANLAVRADAFHAVDGFAEDTLTVVGGEDVDLGIRLTKAGHPILCDRLAVVRHTRKTGDSITSIGARLYTYGRAAHWLNTRHPERRQFRFNPVSAIAAVTLGAAATARATRGRGLAAVPLAAAALIAVHARDRVQPGDGLRDHAAAVTSTLLDWSFDLGEFVGAFQVARPQHLFSRFGFMDTDTFRPRNENTEVAP